MTRLLLDTHVIVWSAVGPDRLPREVRDMIDAADDVFVSAISLWEIVIKQSTGRPILAIADAHQWFSQAMSASGFSLLAIELRHIAAIQHLPLHHRDPFDRSLVAQASVEGLTLVSKDRQLAMYDVSLMWDDQD